VTGPHVTCDTHVGLLARLLVFSWVFNLACSSTFNPAFLARVYGITSRASAYAQKQCESNPAVVIDSDSLQSERRLGLDGAPLPVDEVTLLYQRPHDALRVMDQAVPLCQDEVV
jgi:hypothetical protein